MCNPDRNRQTCRSAVRWSLSRCTQDRHRLPAQRAALAAAVGSGPWSVLASSHKRTSREQLSGPLQVTSESVSFLAPSFSIPLVTSLLQTIENSQGWFALHLLSTVLAPRRSQSQQACSWSPAHLIWLLQPVFAMWDRRWPPYARCSRPLSPSAREKPLSSPAGPSPCRCRRPRSQSP